MITVGLHSVITAGNEVSMITDRRKVGIDSYKKNSGGTRKVDDDSKARPANKNEIDEKLNSNEIDEKLNNNDDEIKNMRIFKEILGKMIVDQMKK